MPTVDRVFPNPEPPSNIFPELIAVAVDKPAANAPVLANVCSYASALALFSFV